MMTRSTARGFIAIAFQGTEADCRHLMLAFLEDLKAKTMEAEGLAYLVEA